MPSHSSFHGDSLFDQTNRLAMGSLEHHHFDSPGHKMTDPQQGIILHSGGVLPAMHQARSLATQQHTMQVQHKLQIQQTRETMKRRLALHQYLTPENTGTAVRLSSSMPPKKAAKRYYYDHFIQRNGTITVQRNDAKMHRFYTQKRDLVMLKSAPLTNLGKPAFSCHHDSQDGSLIWSKPTSPRVGMLVGGVINMTLGIVGSAGAIASAVPTGGASALALVLTIGEIGIGMVQIIDAGMNEKANEESVIQQSSSLPDLVAHSSGYEYAGLVDAGGQFTPRLLSPASTKFLGVMIKERNTAGGIIAVRASWKAARSGQIGTSVYEAASAYDAYGDVKGMGFATWDAFWQALDEKHAREDAQKSNHKTVGGSSKRRGNENRMPTEIDKTDELKDYMRKLPTEKK